MNTWPEDIRDAFHRSWGNCVGSARYSKADWKLLQRYIDELHEKISKLESLTRGG